MADYQRGAMLQGCSGCHLCKGFPIPNPHQAFCCLRTFAQPFPFWDSLPLGLILETTFSRKSSLTCTEMEPSSMPEQNPLLG